MSEENKNIEEPKEEFMNDARPDNPVGRGSSFMERPVDENIAAAEQQQTTNPKLQTEEMEVHHHTHAAHGKKNWRSYLWEFLMLFLAVFCGFLAENKREHYVEHQREKKFSQQLLADLKADSVLLMATTSSMQTALENHKKLTALMTSGNPASNRDIVKACMGLYYIYKAPANNATYMQMRSSGSLRYIQNNDLTVALQKYYEFSRRYISEWEEIEADFYKTYIQAYFINHFMITDIDFLKDTLINQDPVFLKRTKETEMQLINIMATYEGYLRSHLERSIRPAANKVNTIIAILKKEYHLE